MSLGRSGKDYQYYIRGLLFLWWVTFLGIFGLLFQGWRKTVLEGIILTGGSLISLLLCWKLGGVAFKVQEFKTLKIFFLLHPPFLLLWPAKKVRHRMQKMHFYMLVRSFWYNWTFYLYDQEVECKEILLKPWPLCLFMVKMSPVRVPRFRKGS